jgi:cytochrome c551
VLPLTLFVVFSSATFALAKLHPAQPSAAAGSGSVVLGDPYRGELAFEENCASCHGTGGEGGGVGPKLEGNPISLAKAKETIDSGRGVMPAGLVSGKQEQDVLAYLATILGSAE